MPKYKAQILIEIKLNAAFNLNEATFDATEYVKDLQALYSEAISILSNDIITDPSDKEFLESLCVK